jgi:hypothetical protein
MAIPHATGAAAITWIWIASSTVGAVVSLPRKRIQHAIGSAMDSATCCGHRCRQGSLDALDVKRAEIDVGMVMPWSVRCFFGMSGLI